ncbi:uncharacterized protein LOC108144135 [Drosophila elegans]|uniref:uncharacterized protein LOC108144135 n=1 Tax=Drosophila elegans TaxID=30023 RepID=UPI0007E60367|nr:uncharacterized protein LOC108144135 [Drosophila elegans]
MVGLTIFILCLGQIRGHIPDVPMQSEQDLEEGLFNLLLKLSHEEVFETLLVYGENCVFHALSRRLEVPTVLVSSGSTSFDWSFSSLTLILSCGPDDERESIFRTLIKLQRNKRLIYLPKDTQPDSVCDSYSQKEQYNVAMVKEDFNKTGVIYTCRFYTYLEIEEVGLNDSKPIYIEHFQNMHGKPITSMADLVPPRSMLYLDKKSGKRKLTGYLGNLMNSFAQKVNASLQFEILSTQVSFTEIIRRVRQEELDIGISLEASMFSAGFDTTTYPFLLTSYCLMLQFPSKLPINRVFAIIIDRRVLGIILVIFCLLSLLLIYSQKMSWQNLSLPNILLNDITLRGLLGQSHPFPSNASKHLRMIFCILCFASMMMTTMYDAYLQSFFTNPPSENPVRSFKNIGKLKQKLAIAAMEARSLSFVNNSQFCEINTDDIQIIDGWKDFLKMRDSLNISYSYVVTEDSWNIYAEQQKIFKKPIFYYARDLCFSRQVFMSIPMRKYLPYRHIFEEHMVRQQEFGLVSYWRSRSFFEMVRLGIMPLKDLSPPTVYDQGLLLQDVSSIMKMYVAAMLEHIIRQHEFGLVNHWMANSFLDKVRLGITPFKDLSPPTRQEASLVVEDISWLLKLYVASMSRYKVVMSWAEVDMLRFGNDHKLQKVSAERIQMFED